MFGGFYSYNEIWDSILTDQDTQENCGKSVGSTRAVIVIKDWESQWTDGGRVAGDRRGQDYTFSSKIVFCTAEKNS